MLRTFTIPPLQAQELLDFNIESLLFLGLLFLIGMGLLLLSERIFRIRHKWRFRFLFLFVYCTALASGIYFIHIRQDKEEKIRWAGLMSDPHDREAEVLFSKQLNRWKDDTLSSRLAFALQQSEKESSFSQSPSSSERDSLEKHLYRNYFEKCFPCYECFFTFCNPDEILLVSPEQTVDCRTFFQDKAQSGQNTDIPGLYTIDYGLEFYAYLFLHPIPCGHDTLWANIELGRKKFSDVPGKTGMHIPPSYSYAYYFKQDLWSHNGDFLYPFQLKYSAGDSVHFVNWRDYSHLYYPLPGQRTLLLSSPRSKAIDILHNFSLLFLMFGIFGSLCLALMDKNFLGRSGSYSQRLSATTFFMVLLIFSVFGGASLFFMQQVNQNENTRLLHNQTLAILAEMESDYLDVPSESIENRDPLLLQSLTRDIKDLSNLFRTDIYFYATDGSLLCESENSQLIPDCIEADVIHEILQEQSHLLIRKKKFGKNVRGWLAYTPFRNANNQILGFFSIPYFSQVEEWRSEMNRFLGTFLNIFVILSLLTLWVSYLLARRITKPLSLIAMRVSQIRLTHKNQHLEWKRNDEIGVLIRQYNSLVDQLEISSRKLAESEREHAWTEMARQVAHEIKNPLTPIKLQVQQLQRCYRDGCSDFGEKLDRFTQMLSQQIDHLAAIAGTFSQLAKWQKPDMQEICPENIFKRILLLYQADESIDFSLTVGPDCGKISIQADPKFFEQILNNLIKNAIQAIQEKNIGRKGHIRLEMMRTDEHPVSGRGKKEYLRIIVRDNGPGVDADMAEHIFEPHFTTRSTGAGLGLAICRRLADSMNAEILLEPSRSAEPGACFSLFFEIRSPGTPSRNESNLP